MPFGESFLTSIKSNKSIMLDKSMRFRKTLGGFDGSKSSEFNFPKATQEELIKIRNRVQREQKRKNLVLGIGFAILVVIVLVVVF